MQKILDFFEKTHVQYLATIGLDGKPKIRPVQLMFAEHEKLWFCTNNQKELYKELQASSAIELSVCTTDNAWLRIAAHVCFEDNLRIKNKMMEASPLVKKIYKSGDNPIFEAFYLKNGTAIMTDLSGTPPHIVSF